MAGGRAMVLRIPILLLAMADLVILALRLRPWNEVVNLPGEGTTGFDPVICLLIFLFVMWWLSSSKDKSFQKALSIGSFLGLAGGALSVGSILLSGQDSKQMHYAQLGLLAAAAIAWGVAGLRGSNAAQSINVGIVAGAWSAMVSALIACAFVLSRLNIDHPRAYTSDPWKQYEGLAIGNESMQSFVHWLVTATGFLLICPLVGGALGLVFALAGHEEK